MSEVARIADKAPDAKRENRASPKKKEVSQVTSSPVERILFLQRTIGNKAVERLIMSGALQTKLRISQLGDKYEQEADRVAEQVMRMPQPQALSNGALYIQRACPKCENDELKRQPIKEEDEEEKLQRKPMEEDEELQAKATSCRTSEVSHNLESQIQSLKGGGQPLSENSRAFFEPRFGVDLSNVRVHTGNNAIQMNRDVGAKAFTCGSDIYFGSGHSPTNSELTAHELTHVVQQTVGAPLQMKRVDKASSASTEDRYEKEVNQVVAIGESPITSPQQLGYRSPALQMRSRLRSSSLQNSPKLVIQRKVNTWGGEWDTDQYDLRRDSAGGRNFPPRLGIRGVDIKLKFTPGNNVDAELIGLTQSVQAFVNNTASYTNPTNRSESIKSTDAININTGTGETDEGTAIDRAAPYNNPIYAVQSLPSTSLADTNTAAGWGQNGWHYKDNKGNIKSQNATLIDAPSRSNAAKDSRHIFETTALATKGAQAGTYYGSVRWGWRTDNKGNFTKIPLSKVSDGVPSSTFIKAAEIWNPSKSSTGAENVDLPIVDVKVTTAPITGVYPAGFVGPPLQIPSGTRIQILRNATPPSTNGQIKVVDGAFTGNTLEVAPADMANIRDERP
ncbi:MAG: DUF4157 domain-containing protein [Candidatus Methanoperedens sp.]|nr:DUF4157 domain-containing protein [Candidatus Methanoperedens sp.]